MMVGGVVVGCGKDLKFTFPKTKKVKVLEIKRKFISVEWYIENEKQTNKCFKADFIKLLTNSELIQNNSYTLDRMKFLKTICYY